MAKKTVATLHEGSKDGRAYTKVIKMVKSPKTGEKFLQELNLRSKNIEMAVALVSSHFFCVFTACVLTNDCCYPWKPFRMTYTRQQMTWRWVHFYQEKILQNPVLFFWLFRTRIASKTVKSPNIFKEKIIPVFKMSRFTSQNGPFCSPKWIILHGKMGHFRVQNESFWKPEKCKENTSTLFSAF